MEKQDVEHLDGIVFLYDLELGRFIDKFYLQFGFEPDDAGLTGEQEKLAAAFWNNKQVAKLDCLIDLYCKLLGIN